MPARALMVLGTASHVGKSLIATALCRILHQHGVRVAPFKAQNMSLNSAATAEGLEIGRAQALQAEAAGIAASVDMNPILIKPSGDMTSQVVVRGRIWRQTSAADYHLRRVEELLPVVCASYDSLAAEYEIVVLEGAGSPAEINLKQGDLVNMRMASHADASCLLVGDIDRGGVFGSLLGTLLLLDDSERGRICGTVINKFRGDLSLLTPGLTMLEDRTAKPCLGVVPWMHGLALEEEDTLGLPPVEGDEWSADRSPDRRLRIAVLALPSLSNFTDFDPLRSEPSVELRFVRAPRMVREADVVVIPGSKQTAADLSWMRQLGLAAEIVAFAARGPVIGVCGGLQMLGVEIADPDALEGGGTVGGLELLQIRTIMQTAKKTEAAQGQLAAPTLFSRASGAQIVSGYEIHIGRTEYLEGARPFALLGDGWDGAVSACGRVVGTYLHGVFDADGLRHTFLANAREAAGLAPAAEWNAWKATHEARLDAWAAHVESALDMSHIFSLVGVPYRRDRTRE